jgi:hypothetical protein
VVRPENDFFRAFFQVFLELRPPETGLFSLWGQAEQKNSGMGQTKYLFYGIHGIPHTNSVWDRG